MAYDVRNKRTGKPIAKPIAVKTRLSLRDGAVLNRFRVNSGMTEDQAIEYLLRKILINEPEPSDEALRQYWLTRKMSK